MRQGAPSPLSQPGTPSSLGSRPELPSPTFSSSQPTSPGKPWCGPGSPPARRRVKDVPPLRKPPHRKGGLTAEQYKAGAQELATREMQTVGHSRVLGALAAAVNFTNEEQEAALSAAEGAMAQWHALDARSFGPFQCTDAGRFRHGFEVLGKAQRDFELGNAPLRAQVRASRCARALGPPKL